MSGGVASVKLVFADSDEATPDAALAEVVAFCQTLRPKRVDFALYVEDPLVVVDWDVDFGAGRSDAALAFKTALLRAEGEADFQTEMTAGPDLSRQADWVVAEGEIDDPALPSGLAFGLPTPLDGALAQAFGALRLTCPAFGYRFVGAARSGSGDLARTLVRPLAEAQDADGRLGAMTPDLQHALNLAKAEGWTAREGFCVRKDAGAGDAEFVERHITSHLQALYPFLPTQLCLTNWAPAVDFAATAAPGGMQATIAPLRADNYLARAILGALSVALPNRPRRAPPPRQPSHPSAPRPARDYVFLSYAHKDQQSRDVIKTLSRRGVALWCDDGLAPGQAWDECLEDRIRHCTAVIACVSPAYEASKYCRREIKFADLLGKPILPIAVDKYMWGPGLALLFQELQMLDGTQPTWTEAALRQLQIVAPGCAPMAHH